MSAHYFIQKRLEKDPIYYISENDINYHKLINNIQIKKNYKIHYSCNILLTEANNLNKMNKLLLIAPSNEGNSIKIKVIVFVKNFK